MAESQTKGVPYTFYSSITNFNCSSTASGPYYNHAVSVTVTPGAGETIGSVHVKAYYSNGSNSTHAMSPAGGNVYQWGSGGSAQITRFEITYNVQVTTTLGPYAKDCPCANC